MQQFRYSKDWHLRKVCTGWVEEKTAAQSPLLLAIHKRCPCMHSVIAPTSILFVLVHTLYHLQFRQLMACLQRNHVSYQTQDGPHHSRCHAESSSGKPHSRIRAATRTLEDDLQLTGRRGRVGRRMSRPSPLSDSKPQPGLWTMIGLVAGNCFL